MTATIHRIRRATVASYVLEKTKTIPIADISLGERFHKPSDKQIADMAKSLDFVRQITPIIVHPVTHNTYRVVAGATRLLAAIRLHWTHIRADIICGPAIDYQIIEISENIDRRSLTAAQRKEARKKLKQLIAEKMNSVTPAKGGRGKKGGMAEAARQAGVPRSTAQRSKPAQNIGSGQVSDPPSNDRTDVHREDKVNQDKGSGSVSDPPSSGADTKPPARAKPTPTGDMQPQKISISFTVAERKRIEHYRTTHLNGGSTTDCVRGLVREALNSKGF